MKWFRRSNSSPRVPDGHRVYAIGDIHGRCDLLAQLLGRIDADSERRGEARVHLVFLGDLIDRGPESRAVVDLVRAYERAGVEKHFILGNHEEVLLRLLAGERGLLESWLQFGGAECAASYGIDPLRLSATDEGAALAALREAVPADHGDFIAGFADTLRIGDYLFVHAGIRPGIGLDEQKQHDLRWIRSAFLDDRREHGFVVIHGHTISAGVDERHNRIGIDTGAYRSGLLTALAAEGEDRWYLDTSTP